MQKFRYLVGFDIGGTKTEAVLCELISENNETKKKSDGLIPLHLHENQVAYLKERARERHATDRLLGYDHLLEVLEKLTRDVCREAGIKVSELSSIGVGIPGTVHPQTQSMVFGNTMMLVGKPVAADLSKRLEIIIPAFSENDANLFALAETLCGAGVLHAQKNKDFRISDSQAIGIILGTGCGGGLVANGKMIRGRRGGATEIGHSLFADNGHPCYCRRRGCAEQYLSGPALEASFNQRHYAQIQGFPNAAQIFELAEKLDPVAVSVVYQYKSDLARFLGNLTTLFDPDFFVLGGGLSKQKILYENISQEIVPHAFLPNSAVPVYQHQLGDSAGVLGAALLPLTRV